MKQKDSFVLCTVPFESNRIALLLCGRRYELSSKRVDGDYFDIDWFPHQSRYVCDALNPIGTLYFLTLYHLNLQSNCHCTKMISLGKFLLRWACCRMSVCLRTDLPAPLSNSHNFVCLISVQCRTHFTQWHQS